MSILRKKFSIRFLDLQLFAEKIKTAIHAFKGEINKKESVKKGEVFENYVRRYLFPISRYKVGQRTHSFNKVDFVKSSLFPDFIFRCSESGKQFAVGAKFRSVISINQYLNFCNER